MLDQTAPALGSVIENLAALIEERYVYPEVARSIAAELRAQRYSADSPEALVAEIKPFLRGHDGHLSLIWRPSAGSPVGADSPARFDDPEVLRRSNYGVRLAEVRDGVAVLDLTCFCDVEDPRVRAVAIASIGMTANADAVVLDLRELPGGWPSNHLLGHFLAPEPTHVLTMTSRDAVPVEDWTPRDNPLGHRPDIPLYVVIDSRTASAGEAFAYAAQSLGRATVIGAPSAGAANPGDFFPAGGRFQAFIPTMAPIDPRTGGNWEGVGVRPDVSVAPADALDRAVEMAWRDLGR